MTTTYVSQEYNTPLDIANRALQHLGATRITGFDDDSKNANAVAFAYDKLRRAELRRNLWRFAIKRTILRPIDTDTLILSPPTWSATRYYQPGQIVAYSNVRWVNLAPFNYGNTPGSSADWVAYFGPITISSWDSDETYFAGELVWTASAVAGFVNLYASRENANGDTPSTLPTYDATVSYAAGDLVSYSAATYISMIDLNLANTPASTRALWVAATTYSTGNIILTRDGRLYTSVGNGNVGHDPMTDTAGTYWTAASVAPYVQPWLTFTGGSTALSWRYVDESSRIDGAKTVRIIYPLGAGPVSEEGTRNIYRLPSGFMRKAPDDPKAGSTSFLGAPSGGQYRDWDFEGDYIVSSDSDAIMMRFVADITDVREMDDMFCEGLAARIAYEICEELTQSGDKQQRLSAAYARFMTEARMVSSIETGPIELAEDDYITCRL